MQLAEGQRLAVGGAERELLPRRAAAQHVEGAAARAKRALPAPCKGCGAGNAEGPNSHGCVQVDRHMGQGRHMGLCTCCAFKGHIATHAAGGPPPSCHGPSKPPLPTHTAAPPACLQISQRSLARTRVILSSRTPAMCSWSANSISGTHSAQAR